MNNSAVTDYQEDEEEELEVGSLNHSLAQARLTALLSQYDNFTTLVELSLDTSTAHCKSIGLFVPANLTGLQDRSGLE